MDRFGPVPAASIDRWAAGMDEEEADGFRVAIRAMDAVYLKFVHTPENERHPPGARSITPDLLVALFGKSKD
jgi:hypothetical protein